MTDKNFIFYFSLGLINADFDLFQKILGTLKSSSDKNFNFFSCRDLSKVSLGVAMSAETPELPLTEWLKLHKKNAIQARIVLFPQSERIDLYHRIYTGSSTSAYPCWNSEDGAGGISAFLEVKMEGRARTLLLEEEDGPNKTYKHFSFREVEIVSQTQTVPLEKAVDNYVEALRKSDYLKDVFPYFWNCTRMGLFILENLDIKFSSRAEAEASVLPAARKFGFAPDTSPSKEDFAEFLRRDLFAIAPFWNFQWPEKKIRALLALQCFPDLESAVGINSQSPHGKEEYMMTGLKLSEAWYALHSALK